MKYIKPISALAYILCAHAVMPAGSAQAPDKSPVVSIRTGQLRGSLTPDGAAVFKNIPFAQPPVSDLRWREPLPPKAWAGVRDDNLHAIRFGVGD